MTISYDQKENMIVSIEYEDDYHHRYDYDIEFDNETHSRLFLSHSSSGVLYRIKLDRVLDFEQALSTFVLSLS